jgi:6-phosphogluconate dehydrogenase (decarboxylating)
MKIGFIGLGRMGRGMALNQVKAGVPLLVYDSHLDVVKPLREAGAQVANGIAAVARQPKSCSPRRRDRCRSRKLFSTWESALKSETVPC